MLAHKQWLSKADNELQTAQLLLKSNNDFAISTIVYLSQQCAEKALKAYLAFQNQENKKTHDLSLLVTLCSKFDSEFTPFMRHARELNPFNTGSRYPDDNFIMPDISGAQHALNLAYEIVEFVRNKTD